MSDTTWGDPIEVNGKRPTWLGDDEPMRWAVIEPNGSYAPYRDANSSSCINWLGWEHGVAIRLRADHPHYAINHLQKEGQAFELCPNTIRACIAALPRFERMGDGIESLNEWRTDSYPPSMLANLLPKKDVAKVLADRFRASDAWQGQRDYVRPNVLIDILSAWAVSEGLINIEKVGE